VTALNATLEGEPTYPLEIEMFDDEEWQGLQQLLDGLEEDDEGDGEADDDDEGTNEGEDE
jgi:hypothetical protein